MRAIQKGSDKAYDKAKKFLKTHKKPTKSHARLFKNFYKPKSSFIKKEGKKAWAKSMQNKGYVTDPHYEEQLISFIYYTWNLK